MMDKIKKPEGKTTDVVAMLLIKQDEIIDWINEHEKYVAPPQKAMRNEKEIKNLIKELQEEVRIADSGAEQVYLQDKIRVLRWVLKKEKNA